MCGLNGIFAYHYAANPIDAGELSRTRDHMAARGPDGAGNWIAADGRIGFGHRRLAIIELTSAGAQPMVSVDGTLVVTFNGEIYNHRELRRGLEAKGYVFRSNSDTEVLLHLYADKQDAMVHDLRGMFAFAIWDSRRGEVFLARDPYGIKPLYYADDGWTFRFASQVKALLAGGRVSRDIDPAGQVGFFLMGSVPEPFTMYREIRSLPAGSTLRVNRVGPETPKRFHSIAAAYATTTMTNARQAEEETIAALRDSVRAHLVADVPVGAFLSAGIDSGALVGLMRDAGVQDLQTVTIAFEEYRRTSQDEAPFAEQVARAYGTSHTTRVVTREEFEADLSRIMEAMDQPSIDGLNTWFVSKAARERGLKVAISGLGGDELLGGYPSFRDLPRWVHSMAVPSRVPLLGAGLRHMLASTFAHFGMNPKAAGMVELGGTWASAYLLRRGLYMPWELKEVLDRETIQYGLERLAPIGLIGNSLEPKPGSAFGLVATMESSNYMRNQLLRDTDWASMGHSLEVRVPLVDHVLLSRLAPLAAKLRAGEGKQLLARAPTQRLPAVVAERAKTGFTTPVAGWMQALLATRRGAYAPVWRQHRSRPWARDWSRVVAQSAAADRG